MMKIFVKIITYSFLPLLFLAVYACDELEELNTGLTETEIVEGLKTALNIGTDSSVSTASAVDGYLKNEAIKILLPNELKALQDTINNGTVKLGFVKVPYKLILDTYVELNDNIDQNPFDELLTAMNRGAEKAAARAKPIFVDAITNMSLTDGLSILQGDSTAATDYFKANTGAALTAAFTPDVKSALDQTSATAIYSEIRGFLDYEHHLNFGVAPIKVSEYIKIEIPETLEGYATEKAVNGIFHLVGKEEQKIRADPFAWASDIIAKVFGSEEAKNGN